MMEGTSALAMLSASADPAMQLAAAKRFVNEKINAAVAPLTGAHGYGHNRLRIGYLSSDFCSHAVSILTAELYELHDRSKFEVYAFSWSREDGSPIRARVVKAMDHYIRIDKLSDEQAARTIRAHEIDILVDLHGLTLGARPQILAYRPAPVQLTYLGFPGSTGLPGVDYVIADEFLITPEMTEHFTEKPLYLPDCFQINDRQRAIAPKPTRASVNLPEDAFVFCSFNNNFKFTPDLFEVWMNILRRVPNSVLWLVADYPEVRENLFRYAEQAGIDRNRLIFNTRAVPAEYLARYQLADLFLDTFPFNAGTTASDALWAGLPLLTCAGQTFSSRMAGSLLRAVDLPQLITHSFADYEEGGGTGQQPAAHRRDEAPAASQPPDLRAVRQPALRAQYGSGAAEGGQAGRAARPHRRTPCIRRKRRHRRRCASTRFRSWPCPTTRRT
jgi:predicted O-linked N-acetylglucosamine transferase (SPINDLY family)